MIFDVKSLSTYVVTTRINETIRYTEHFGQPQKKYSEMLPLQSGPCFLKSYDRSKDRSAMQLLF